MNLAVETKNEFKIATINGRLDTTNAGEFEQQITALLDGGCKKLVLDCSGLNYISSSGLRIFLVIQKKMKLADGQFRLCSLQPAIKDIFDIAGFSVILSLFADKDSALNEV
jgi:anti-anti-sigma factor